MSNIKFVSTIAKNYHYWASISTILLLYYRSSDCFSSIYKARAIAPKTIARIPPAACSADAAPVNSAVPVVVAVGFMDAITVPFAIGPTLAAGVAAVVPLPALDYARKPLQRPWL